MTRDPKQNVIGGFFKKRFEVRDMKPQELIHEFETESESVVTAFVKKILIDDMITKTRSKSVDLSEYYNVLKCVYSDLEKAVDEIHEMVKDFPVSPLIAHDSFKSDPAGKKPNKRPRRDKKLPSGDQGPCIPKDRPN